MKIAIAPYELKLQKQFANSATTARMGALLRIEYPTAVGYADVFSWPELGDPTVEETLSSLATGKPNSIAKQSLHFAQIDAEASISSSNPLSGLEIPESHYLCYEIDSKRIETLREKGFTTFKIKVSANLPEFFRQSPPLGMKFRLDFNGKLSANEFENVLEKLGPAWLSHIDFFEDPTAFDAETWLRWNEKWGVRIALDRAPLATKASLDERFDKGPAPFTTVIVKPAIEDEMIIRRAAADNMRRLVYTHNLDHPLGRACALWSAACALASDPLLVDASGFAGDEIYERNAYFEISDYSQGSHWGMESLLERERWKSIG